MARIRTIKPEFNKSASVARLSDHAQLFMLKILVEMDDQGRIEWLPRTILGNLYPYDEGKDATFLENVVKELEGEGIFVRYEVEGRTYGHFPKWDDHQVVKNPSKPRCPEPPGTCDVENQHSSPDGGETLTTSSVGSTETLTESSPLEMGNGKREMGESGGCARDPEFCSKTERIENAEIVVSDFVEDPPDADAMFGRFKAAYPETPNWNEVTAKRAFGYLLESNVDLNQVVEGAQRFAVAIRAADREGTQFVMAPSTFLKLGDRHWEAPWKPPKRGKSGESVTDMQQRLEAVLNGEKA